MGLKPRAQNWQAISFYHSDHLIALSLCKCEISSSFVPPGSHVCDRDRPPAIETRIGIDKNLLLRGRKYVALSLFQPVHTGNCRPIDCAGSSHRVSKCTRGTMVSIYPSNRDTVITHLKSPTKPHFVHTFLTGRHNFPRAPALICHHHHALKIQLKKHPTKSSQATW